MCSDEERWLSRIDTESSSAGTALGELSCSASDLSSPSMLQTSMVLSPRASKIKQLLSWLCTGYPADCALWQSNLSHRFAKGGELGRFSPLCVAAAAAAEAVVALQRKHPPYVLVSIPGQLDARCLPCQGRAGISCHPGTWVVRSCLAV